MISIEYYPIACNSRAAPNFSLCNSNTPCQKSKSMSLWKAAAQLLSARMVYLLIVIALTVWVQASHYWCCDLVFLCRLRKESALFLARKTQLKAIISCLNVENFFCLIRIYWCWVILLNLSIRNLYNRLCSKLNSVTSTFRSFALTLICQVSKIRLPPKNFAQKAVSDFSVYLSTTTVSPVIWSSGIAFAIVRMRASVFQNTSQSPT